MKIALIIAYVLIAILAVVVFMEWKFIQALTPKNSGGGSGSGNAPGSSQDTTANDKRSASADQGDGSATFGSMIDAVKAGAKEMELKVTFDN